MKEYFLFWSGGRQLLAGSVSRSNLVSHSDDRTSRAIGTVGFSYRVSYYHKYKLAFYLFRIRF